MPRRPAVAGAFYPGGKARLQQAVESLCREAGDQVTGAVGAVSPHAGYVYSGATAALALSALGPAQTFIIIGPNHRGVGAPLAVSAQDWETPLGVAACDAEFVEHLPAPMEVDESAHRAEHSVEVQLPFLQHLYPSARVACICMGDQSQGAARAVAEAVLAAQKRTGREIKVVASSDFSHYVPADAAQKADGAVLSAVTAMDVNGTYAQLSRTRASVCGFGPIAAAVEASRGLGARSAKMLKYTTSGEASGDLMAVVGYAAVVFLA